MYEQNPRVWNFSNHLKENADLNTEILSQQQAHLPNQCYVSKVMKAFMSYLSAHMREARITVAKGALTLNF